MSSEIIFEILESPEGGYEARALGYPIFTQADSEEELKTMLKDAVRCHFEVESDRPKLIRLHWVRDELISACAPARSFWFRSGKSVEAIWI